jgi:hypothetical protein
MCGRRVTARWIPDIASVETASLNRPSASFSAFAAEGENPMGAELPGWAAAMRDARIATSAAPPITSGHEVLCIDWSFVI